MAVTDQYPTIPLAQFQGKPIGKAKFKEPVYRRGVFQNQYIEVEVTVFSGEVMQPGTRIRLIPVRFGKMNVIRFVNEKLLYERK